MGLLESGQNNQKTRDEIGQGSSTFPKIKMFGETIPIEEGPSIIQHESITGSAIYGSATFGVYGTSTYGASTGGTFILGHSLFGVLGTGELGSGSSTIVYSVTNPNNIFIERFAFDYFKDTTTFTAEWDTTNQNLYMTTGTNHTMAYNTIATFNSIFLNQTTILNAKVASDEVKWGSDLIKYYLSADGGDNWEEATNNVKHVFTITGQDLRLKVVFIGNGASSTYVNYIRVEYNK